MLNHLKIGAPPYFGEIHCSWLASLHENEHICVYTHRQGDSPHNGCDSAISLAARLRLEGPGMTADSHLFK